MSSQPQQPQQPEHTQQPQQQPQQGQTPPRNRVLPSAESIRSVGGLVAVAIGVVAVTGLAITTMAFVESGHDANTLIPLSTAAFGVISAIVGAYLGIKIGTDQTKSLAQDATQARAQLTAVQGYVPAEQQQAAAQAGKEAAADVLSPTQ
jgi:hypothetical protein